MEIRDKALKAAHYGLELKAERPVLMDLRHLTGMTDYFVIMSAQTNRQTENIAEHIKYSFAKMDNLRPSSEERDDKSQWILLDYVDFVVHVFMNETREYYDLERLWGEAEAVEII